MKLVSISRRTDIPAFYAEWLINRIRAGFCHWINPVGGQVYRVSLLPDDCAGLIFWTRYPKPLLAHLSEIENRGHRFYFHYTITGYDRLLESHNPDAEKSLQVFRLLSDRISPARIFWRYDPIVISTRTSSAHHIERFSALARQLRGHTRRCYFSFVDMYGKTRRNLARIEAAQEIAFADPQHEARKELTAALNQIAQANGIELYSCCEDALLAAGVRKARCVDLEPFGAAAKSMNQSLKYRPTRQECGCLESVDIGAYDTCRFGCVYCYATNSREAATYRAKTHDPQDSALWRPATLAGRDLTDIEIVR